MDIKKYNNYEDRYIKCRLSEFRIEDKKVIFKSIHFGNFSDEELIEFKKFSDEEKELYLNGWFNYYIIMQY